MAKGNVNINKQQGAGQPRTGKDHYLGMLMYLTPGEYPVGIIRSWAAGLTAVVGDYFESPIDWKVYKATPAGGLTGGANAGVDPLLAEVTDPQELAEARTGLVTTATMDGLGIVEGSNADAVWFQANAFFEKFPNGFFWLRIADLNLGTTTFDEMDDIVTLSQGDVRKIGVYNNGNNAAFAAAQTVALQVKYAEYDAAKTPLHIAYFPTSYTEAYAAFIDLKSSGNNYGVAVYNVYDYIRADIDYPAMGVVLGYWAKSKISESIGWVEKYNFVSSPVGSNTNAENDSICIFDTNGVVSYATLKGAVEDILDNKGWNFLVKYANVSGSYLNDMYTVSIDGNDFEAVFYVCTLDKASRLIRAALVPQINSEIRFNSDGTLTDVDHHKFTGLAKQALEVMATAEELTLPANAIVIDRTQDVAGTKTLEIAANVILNGVAKTINVSLSRIKAAG
jgi:hypothetical protein